MYTYRVIDNDKIIKILMKNFDKKYIIMKNK